MTPEYAGENGEMIYATAPIKVLHGGYTGSMNEPAGIVHKDESYASDRITEDILRGLQNRIGEANAAKGFHEEGDWLREGVTRDRPDGDLDGVVPYIQEALRTYYTARLALIATEVAEAIEELRSGRRVGETYYVFDDGEGDAPTGFNPDGSPRKPEGVPSELADIVIRSFDFADEAGIDLAAMIFEKLAYNETRPFKHGRTM